MFFTFNSKPAKLLFVCLLHTHCLSWGWSSRIQIQQPASSFFSRNGYSCHTNLRFNFFFFDGVEKVSEWNCFLFSKHYTNLWSKQFSRFQSAKFQDSYSTNTLFGRNKYFVFSHSRFCLKTKIKLEKRPFDILNEFWLKIVLVCFPKQKKTRAKCVDVMKINSCVFSIICDRLHT